MDIKDITSKTKDFINGVKEKYNLMTAVRDGFVSLWNAIKTLLDNIGKKKP